MREHRGNTPTSPTMPQGLPVGPASAFGENTHGITNPDGAPPRPSHGMTQQKTIEIVRVTHLRGPNIWTYRPVIEAWVDIGELEDYPSNTLPGFVDRLCAWLPSLVEHECSPGVRGGFLQRLREGTWAAHILEHLCLEL